MTTQRVVRIATTSGVSQNPSIEVQRAKCRYCDRILVLGRSLTQHVKLGHPNEYNEFKLSLAGTISETKRGKLWSDDERNVLALLEIEALHLGCSGTTNVNKYIAKNHRGRTLEGIKAERRSVPYQNALRLQQQLKAGVASGYIMLPVKPQAEAGVLNGNRGTPLLNPDTSTTGSASNVEVVFENNRDVSQEGTLVSESNNLRRRIEQGIETLSTKRKFLAPTLVKAAKAVLLDRCDTGPMMEWFTGIAGSKQPAIRTNRKGNKKVRKGIQPRRPQGRIEYARLQSLFRRAPKGAARYILEGNRKVDGGPKEDAMFEFWEGIFGTDGIAQMSEGDGEIGSSHISEGSVLDVCGPIEPLELGGSNPKRGTSSGPDGLEATR